jgi:hypothetical protein
MRYGIVNGHNELEGMREERDMDHVIQDVQFIRISFPAADTALFSQRHAAVADNSRSAFPM